MVLFRTHFVICEGRDPALGEPGWVGTRARYHAGGPPIMAGVNQMQERLSAWSAGSIPGPVLGVFRGVGQVFFQENALTGALFVLGIALSSPLMALGAGVGSAIGLVTARALKFDEAEVLAGIYGFNSTLVGIATFFFFRPGAVSVLLLVAGCIASAVVTRLMRRYLPFPTYTLPFIVTTWAVYFLGL